MKVSIEYKKIHCFSYLLPFIKYAEAKARVLELCAHHNQVKMMQEAFEKWTEFIKSDTANAPLVVAATRGHIDSVQFLLTKCTNVEISIKSPYVDENYPTPLLAAAAGGYLAILRELVAAGAKTRQDIDSELPDPLLKGIATRNVAMLACLVEHNWSILNNRSDSIDTVLDIAIEHDHAELVEWTLLKSTINRSGYHKSRLRSACQRGHIEIMHMLLNYWAYSPELLPSHPEEAEVHQVDRYGPARSRHTLILELLREHCTKDSPISDAPSIVSRLAWMGDVRGLKRLFMDEPNVDVNVEDKYKKSPLFDAMHRHLRWRQGHLSGSPQQWLQITKMLLDRGAKFNMKDAWHLKALYGGVPKEIVEDLRNLVKNGKY
jgi:ankyrin repeat protein